MKTEQRERGMIEETYEVVVIGGGLAGMCAAIAAARLGCRTVLVQDRPVLGGNASSEIRVPIGGAASGRNRNARETGIIEELLIENAVRNPEGSFPIRDSIYWEWVTREPNLRLYLNTRAKRVLIDEGGDRIAAVEADQDSTERRFRFKGTVFIDASGDGQIAYEAGALFRMGREGRDEFGESRAPEAPDDKTLGSTIYFYSRDVGHPVPFRAPSWARVFPSDADLPHRNHADPSGGHRFWWMEYGGVLDTIEDNERIREELLRVVYGVWDHIKNRGDHGAETYVLDWVGTIPGKRESRRFVGDYMLTQNDIESRRLFPDRVAYGGWPIDTHPPEGIYSPEPPCEQPPLPGIYSIPFRSLYSKTIRNLMFAGRNISASHVAFASTRLMATCAVEGQAVGTAAWLCVRHNTTPRGIYEGHMRELQQLILKGDGYIIGVRNEDPEDRARGATVTASSSAVLEVVEAKGARALDARRGQLFTISERRLEGVHLLLRSTRSDEIEIPCGLRRAYALDDFSAVEDLTVVMGRVQRGTEWVTFAFNLDVEPGLYWIWLPPLEGVAWCYGDGELLGTRRAYWPSEENAEWDRAQWTYCFRLTPCSRPYGGENVVNGIARPERGPHLWISDPSEPLPQYLELDFGDLVRFNTVHLKFDTNLDCRGLELKGPVSLCVRDYALRYDLGDGMWRELHRETGNYHRHRIHRFQTVTARRLRLEVLGTNGAPSARVYEVRVYEES